MKRLSRVRSAAWATAGLLAAAIAVGVLLFSNSSSEERGVAGRPIDSSNVSSLEVAWRLPLTAKSIFGSYASTPVVAGEVVYSQDLASSVQAIDLQSGRVLWTKSYESPSPGPNGVVVAGGRVFGATENAAFALDRKSGRQLWSVSLVRNGSEGIDMAPGFHDGTVYMSTVPVSIAGAYRGGGAGVLWALDARTGRKLWHFDTVPRGLWGRPEVNSGGGLWYPPAFDDEGSMYFGVGNPAPFPGTEAEPWGSSRPGPNLYTDSMVKLNAKSGKLQWYYQQTPHDVYDWDFQDQPILASARGRELAIGAGKSGVVVAVDRKTGQPVWKRAVGTHNGHDRDSIRAMHREYLALKPAMVFPGELGGVIAPMATNGALLFVPVVDAPLSISSRSRLRRTGAMRGELVALDLATGAVAWRRRLPSPAFGAPATVNDLVFATTYAGDVYVFDANNGQRIWQAKLPAGTNTGVTVAGDTVIAPAGVAAGPGQAAQIVAYRLGG
jgi:outer membrane protein assembly factor BamB